ncbi:MAG: hypothetical protein IK127_01750 [Clostridia bacterium]|nr:hypothetical protein [Clostridia bacterium]
MPETTFVMLPDEIDAVPLADGTGLVGANRSLMRMAAEAMKPAPPEPGRSPSGVTPWRGLLAFVLLSDQFPEGHLAVESIGGSASPLSRAVLASLKLPSAQVATWNRDGHREVLGMADPAWGILPAAQPPALLGLMPEGVRWLEHGSAFGDPLPWLTPLQRTLLAKRLRAFDSSAILHFAEDVERLSKVIADRALKDEDSGDWQTAVTAAACLPEEPFFCDCLALERINTPPQAHNPLLKALGLQEPAVTLPPEGIWRWRGEAFAQLSGTIGLEPVPGDQSAAREALAELDENFTLLGRWSPRFCADAGERLTQWEEANQNWLLPAAREKAAETAADFRKLAAQPHEAPAFTLPLDTSSPALGLILRDALGKGAETVALHTFSERVILFPGGLLGDVRLEEPCSLIRNGETVTLLPPLSAAVAEDACRRGWAVSPVDPTAIRVHDLEDGTIEVSLQLRGHSTITLTRRYTPEEQITADQVPAVSLWPSVPPAYPGWKYYLISVLGACSIGYLRGDRWQTLDANGSVPLLLNTDTYPAALSVYADGQCAGALVSLDVRDELAPAGNATGSVDPGSSGLRMALSVAGQTEPFSLPSLWRILLRRGTDYSVEPLPVYPFESVLSSSVRLAGETEEPWPFVDGAIANNPDDPDALGDLIWQTGNRTRTARKLLFREALLLLSLRAAMAGAESLRCRLVLPDEMTSDGRESLLGEFAGVASSIGKATGLPCSAECVFPASAALFAYGRQALPNRAFVLLDIGAGSAGLAIWLRGPDRPALALNIGSGISDFLSAVFSLRPDWLRNELWVTPGMEPNETGRRMLRACDAAERAAASPAALDLLRRSLDSLLGPHFTETAQTIGNACSRSGMPSRIQALLLFIFACRLSTVGLALEKLRWDGSLSVMLPPELPLMLCGRGPKLISTFDGALQWQLGQFPRLFMTGGHPVVSLPSGFGEHPGLETAMGASAVPALPEGPALSHLNGVLPPARLAANFLLAFRMGIPAAAELLFPGCFTPDGSLSPFADTLLTDASTRYGSSESTAYSAILEDIMLNLMHR